MSEQSPEEVADLVGTQHDDEEPQAHEQEEQVGAQVPSAATPAAGATHDDDALAAEQDAKAPVDVPPTTSAGNGATAEGAADAAVTAGDPSADAAARLSQSSAALGAEASAASVAARLTAHAAAEPAPPAEHDDAPAVQSERGGLLEDASAEPSSQYFPLSDDAPQPEEEEEALIRAEQHDSFQPAEHNFLPAFANAENKALNRSVQTLEGKLEETEAGLEEVADRTSVMGEHLRSVQSELAFTQQRLTSKAKEVQSEAHLRALGEREAARLDADARRLAKERGELRERVLGLQGQIYRANERMDQFRVLMNWNQEELEQWAVTQQQKEEDNDAIAAYRAQDAGKVKELTLAVERASKTVYAHKAELEREVTGTQAAQVQLDKAADDFARLHKERQDLTRQWDDAQEQMRRNDEAIAAATQLFADRNARLRDRQTRLDASAKALDEEMVGNKEREAQIELLNRSIERARAAYATEHGRLAELSEQVEMLKAALSKAGSDYEAAAAANRGLQGELQAKRGRLDDMRARVAANRRKLDGDYSHLGSLEAREKELEALRALEGTRMAEVEKQLAELEKLQFSKAQQLFKARAREKDLISEISGGQAQNRNVVTKIQALDDNVIRQQELLYNVEFQLQQMERRVARAKGERSDEEAKVLNERVRALTGQLDGANEQHGMLLGQVRKAEDDLSKANAAHARLTKDCDKVQGDMAALAMETDTVARGVKAAAAHAQQRLVDLDVQKLEVQGLRRALNAKADEVFTLENKKFQLQQSLHERRHEIDVHRQTLEAELKLLRDDCHRVTLELQERRLRVSRLDAKFAVLSNKGRSLYDDEAPKSQAYYVIKSAQEREELQKQGDALDSTNQRLQREVAALEGTLEQMIQSNTAYSRSFKPANEKRAFEERAALRGRLDRAYDRLKFKRANEHAAAGDVVQAEARCAALQAEAAGVSHAVEELARRRDEAADAIQDQEELLERAQGRYNHLVSTAEGQAALPAVKATMLRDCNAAMAAELRRLSVEYPALGILEALREAGVALPAAADLEEGGRTFEEGLELGSWASGMGSAAGGSQGRAVETA